MWDKYIKDVSTLRLDSSKCTGCGMCINVCPHGVFCLTDGKARVNYKDLCMECGAAQGTAHFQPSR